MLTGALPAIGTADMPRDETQAWARAIYEDKPAGGSIVGVRYTSAHDEGAALAVWDSASHIQVLQDRQLVDPPILRRFVVAMDEVDIDVQVVAPGECRPCREANGRGHPC
jgi:hypothetical protein